MQASLRDLAEPVSRQFARDFQASTAYVPLPEEFFEGILTESIKLPARLWGEVLDGLLAFDDTRLLGRIQAPTLLLWGERDALFSLEDQQSASPRRSRRPGSRIYPETGHCPNWERPEQVATDLDAFIPDT